MNLSFRLLRGKQSLIVGYCLVFSLGLGLYLVTASLRENFSRDLESRSREVTESEISVHARRALSFEEEKKIDSLLPSQSIRADVWGFLSMLRKSDTSDSLSPGQSGTEVFSLLCQIKAISPNYPLFGAFRFLKRPANSLESGQTWISEGLARRMKLGVGDSLHIGYADFEVVAIFTDPPGGGFDFFDFGLKLYIPLADMAKTRLEQKGSRIFRYRFYDLPDSSDFIGIQKEIQTAISDPEIEIGTFQRGGGELSKRFDMVFAFMKIVTVCAFLMAAIGAAYFFFHHAHSERKNLARLMVLGAPWSRIFKILALQNALLVTLSLILAFVWTLLLNRLFAWAVAKLFSLSVTTGISNSVIVEALLFSMISSVLFTALAAISLRSLAPGQLLRPPLQLVNPWKRKFSLLISILVALPLLFMLCFWSTRSLQISLIFSGLVMGGLVFSALGGLALFKIFSPMITKAPLALRLAKGELALHWDRSLLLFSVMAFVTAFTTLVPGLQRIILSELSAPKGEQLPQLFLFDIQEDQIDSLKQLMLNLGQPLKNISPMVRARLTAVNGQVYERDTNSSVTVENEQDKQFRNRGFNLSYRDQLSSAELITKGQLWKGAFPENPEAGMLCSLSVEAGFAERLKIELGDTLRFDVQGVEVEGLITSLRRVRWASFQPNFFVLFQPGVLELAPKTFLATLNSVNETMVTEIQNQCAQKFPNVSVIHVKEMIERVTSVLGKLKSLVISLSLFSISVGLCVLLLIVRGMADDAKRSALLLAALGSSPSRLFTWQAFQFCSLFGIAGCFGLGISQLGLWIINRLFWQIPYQPFGPEVAMLALLCVLMGLGTTVYASLRLLRAYRGGLRDLLGKVNE